MDLGLRGRSAVVAGASAGLGFACAEALVAEGVSVVIGSRDAERNIAAAERLGNGTKGLIADLHCGDAGADFVERAAVALGGFPDILILNSGGPPKGGFNDVGRDAFLPAIEQNLLSAVGMCEAAAPPMQERGWGRVIAITSIAVRQPIPYLILSNTARAGLTSYLKSMSMSLVATGVTVNSLLPGGHATERVIDLYGQSAGVEHVPMGRTGRPADFGAACAFLASEQAGFITGVTLPVDGGYNQGLM